ncbi:hypothetical protein ZHAS_00022116 [Anopheles sinensis]|uniref:Uncharacterized protein n=1 Tax=Anopheles sinensis TaxID=74873 RepID=A0A084WU43_ANOSI|nr:hypothetical protein ZHAS_00022116 [Anopheles sinensis]
MIESFASAQRSRGPGLETGLGQRIGLARTVRLGPFQTMLGCGPVLNGRNNLNEHTTRTTRRLPNLANRSFEQPKPAGPRVFALNSAAPRNPISLFAPGRKRKSERDGASGRERRACSSRKCPRTVRCSVSVGANVRNTTQHRSRSGEPTTKCCADISNINFSLFCGSLKGFCSAPWKASHAQHACKRWMGGEDSSDAAANDDEDDADDCPIGHHRVPTLTVAR